jgi:tRNA nucleotidyltransferase (CCA-adding enzyme)
MADYIYMMESRLTPEQKRGVTLVQDVAREHGMNVYLVGGVVRDIISGALIRDLDFAVQGNALKLQKDIEKAGAVIQGVDENLRTLYLLMPGNLRGEIASTRHEVYDKPGKPPEITPATINEDLRRRDFTVNAMALSLNPGSRGLLLDPFNGVADIEAKHIRVLHNYSFLEEPSRLIRATRFLARYEWTFEERTQARFDSAKENDYISHVNRKLLGHEIEQVAHENDPLKVMRALEKEGWLKVLHPHWSVAKVDVSGLNHLLKIRLQLQNLGYTVEAGPAIMSFITDKMNSSDIGAIQSAIARKAFVHDWKHLDADAKELARRLTGKEAATNSQTWKLLQSARPETIMYTAATSRVSAAVKKINDFMGKWRQIKTRFPLPEMAELRITPELPEYSKIVEEMFLLFLDNKLRNQTEIIKFLTPYSPPLPAPPPAPVRRGRAKKAEKAKAAKGAASASDQKSKEGQEMQTQAAEAKPALTKVAEAVGKAAGTVVKAAKAAAAGPRPIANAKTMPAAPAKAAAKKPESTPHRSAAKAASKKSAKPASKPAKKSPPKKQARKKK